MTIRRTPDDFLVEEIPAAERAEAFRNRPSHRAPYAVYELTKTSLATPDAVGMFAKAAGVRPGLVAYAGLKDKHARTIQLITVRTRNEAEARKLPATLERQDGAGKSGAWSARRVGWAADEAAAAWIHRNRFTIVVRDLSRDAAAEMERRAAALATPAQAAAPQPSLLLINYFGDQRFGSARHGQGFIARHLVRGEFEDALRLAIATPARKDTGKKRQFTRLAATHWGDWATLREHLPRLPEFRAIDRLASGADFRTAFAALPYFTQQMAVEAYQSRLWNATARRLAAAIAEGTEPIRADDPFGEMLFPPGASVGEAWESVRVPMLAPSTELIPPWAEAAAAALAEEEISHEALRIPGLRRPAFEESWRPLLATAERFAMSEPEPDDLGRATRLKRTVTFDLPRGAYATVLLRALGQ